MLNNQSHQQQNASAAAPVTADASSDQQPQQQQLQQQPKQQQQAGSFGGFQRPPIGASAASVWPYNSAYGGPPQHGGWGSGSGSSYEAGELSAWGGGGGYGGYGHPTQPHHQQQRRPQHHGGGGGVDSIERGMAGLKTGPPKDTDFPALGGGVGGGIGVGMGGGRSAAPKTWAKIAAGSSIQQQQGEGGQQQQKPRALGRGTAVGYHPAGQQQELSQAPALAMQPADLDEHIRRLMQSVNPPTLEVPDNSEFYVIKSYSEDDIHRAIKYSIWCSTPHGNTRLNKGYQRASGLGGRVYLLFSVNGSGHFCGVAQMTSEVDNSKKASVWCQDKWQGQFSIVWLLVKDVPNSQLRHIKIVSNENKPVTNSRDCTQVPLDQGRQVLSILLAYRNSTSIFDDFSHYERRELEGNIVMQ